MKAVVPDGVQPAQISAILGGNTGLSATNFKPTLSIFSFSPLSGTAGATVTIKGIGFNASSRVKFAGASPVAPATFSASTLTVTVRGRDHGKISVTHDRARRHGHERSELHPDLADLELGVRRYRCADIGENDPGNRARHAPDDLPVVAKVRARRRVNAQHAQPAVRVPAVVQPATGSWPG